MCSQSYLISLQFEHHEKVIIYIDQEIPRTMMPLAILDDRMKGVIRCSGVCVCVVYRGCGSVSTYSNISIEVLPALSLINLDLLTPSFRHTHIKATLLYFVNNRILTGERINIRTIPSPRHSTRYNRDSHTHRDRDRDIVRLNIIMQTADRKSSSRVQSRVFYF
jgi:hypothetical protein